MPDFTLTQGDTTPALTGTLVYADGTVPNLTGATVNVVLKNVDATATYLNAPATVLGNIATYNWTPTATSVPGDYVGQFIVTFGNGTIQSFPTYGYFTLTIIPSLEGITKPRPVYIDTRDVITQCRSYLEGRTRPGRNVLASSMDPTTNQITFTYPVGAAAAGVNLSVGLENMYVFTTSGQTSTVQRGVDGSLPAQHATGDTVLIDPEFSDFEIFRAINQEIFALQSARIYAVKNLTRTLLSWTDGYDLATDVQQVMDVRIQSLADPTQWDPMNTWDVVSGMDTSIFPSGTAIFLPDRPVYNPYYYGTQTTGTLGNQMRITYRADLLTLSGLNDDVITVTGIPASAVDILGIGAALRLMSGRPISRVFNLSQPDPRSSLETKAGDVVNAPAALRQLYTTRVNDESNNLSSLWVDRAPARRLMTGYTVGSRYRRTGWW